MNENLEAHEFNSFGLLCDNKDQNLVWVKQFFYEKKEYSKNSFKTSWFLKKMQKIGLPEKNGLSREPRHYETFFSGLFP